MVRNMVFLVEVTSMEAPSSYHFSGHCAMDYTELEAIILDMAICVC